MRRVEVALLLAFFGTAVPAFAGGLEQEKLGGDFTLTDHNGDPFSLTTLRGKVVMLFFGYTYCPDVCPLTMAITAQVLHSLGERSKRVVPLFVSLDPKRDTPEVLAPYVAHFHPAIIGLTGEAAVLKRVAERFNVRFAFHGDTAADRYTLDHTPHLFLLDQEGRVVAIVPFGLPAEQVQTRVAELLDDGIE